MHVAPVALSSGSVDRRSRPINSMGRTQMSLSKVFADPRNFRARFAGYWSEFLRANYGSPEQVAVSFGVRYQTAVNWWNGDNRPSGDVVAMAGKPFNDFMEGRA